MRTTFILMVLSAHCAFGANLWIESIDGDLSNAIGTPTAVGTLGLGENVVTGELTNTSGFDPDVFTFSVAAGQELESIEILSMSGTNHFFGFDSGTSVASSAPSLFIATLIGSGDTGDNLLVTQAGGGSFGGAGVPSPLGPGDYTFWFQETNGSDVSYSFNINTIPEPSTGALGLLGLGLCLRLRRR